MNTPTEWPTEPDQVPDWTRGQAGVALQRCRHCAHVWYFHREFCPACGQGEPLGFAASGTGVVYAATVVYRAPDDAFRAIAPYALVLIELDEGPRMMAHAAPELAIGERAVLGFRSLAGRLLPWFERTESRQETP